MKLQITEDKTWFLISKLKHIQITLVSWERNLLITPKSIWYGCTFVCVQQSLTNLCIFVFTYIVQSVLTNKFHSPKEWIKCFIGKWNKADLNIYTEFSELDLRYLSTLFLTLIHSFTSQFPQIAVDKTLCLLWSVMFNIKVICHFALKEFILILYSIV